MQTEKTPVLRTTMGLTAPMLRTWHADTLDPLIREANTRRIELLRVHSAFQARLEAHKKAHEERVALRNKRRAETKAALHAQLRRPGVVTIDATLSVKEFEALMWGVTDDEAACEKAIQQVYDETLEAKTECDAGVAAAEAAFRTAVEPLWYRVEALVSCRDECTLSALTLLYFDFETNELSRLNLEAVTDEAERRVLKERIELNYNRYKRDLWLMHDHSCFTTHRHCIKIRYEAWLLMLYWFKRREDTGLLVAREMRRMRLMHLNGTRSDEAQALYECERLWIEAWWAQSVDAEFAAMDTGGKMDRWGAETEDGEWRCNPTTALTPDEYDELVAQMTEPLQVVVRVDAPRHVEGVMGYACMVMHHPAEFWRSNQAAVERRMRLTLNAYFMHGAARSLKGVDMLWHRMDVVIQRFGVLFVHNMLRALEDWAVCQMPLWGEGQRLGRDREVVQACAWQWKCALWHMALRRADEEERLAMKGGEAPPCEMTQHTKGSAGVGDDGMMFEMEDVD